MPWDKGTEVSRIDNPGKQGATTGQFRQRGAMAYHGVRWRDGSQDYVAEDQLAPLNTTLSRDPYVVLESGRLGRSEDLRRSLTHVHLSGRLANLVYSMGVTNTEFFAHQYKPLLTLLESPADGLLIADEVGLGKTIEAGIIWTELRAREDMRRLLVVCPAMLREKWRDELKLRFGIDATIVNAKTLVDELKHSSSAGPSKAWITSYQSLRPPKTWKPGAETTGKRLSARTVLANLLDDNSADDPLVDLVVFDEAPSNGLENKRLEAAYRMLGSTAWIRSLARNDSTIDSIDVSSWHKADALASNDLHDCHVFPEFVAQMAGYLQSPQRQKGLHALIDVGGGTLDIATFIVHVVDHEDTFPFLVPQVHPLGTHGMLQNRYARLTSLAKVSPVDELDAIDDSSTFALKSGIDLSHVNARDAAFSDELRGIVRSVFELTKNRRYRLADAWGTGIRTFFTGGGSHVALYSDATLAAKVPGSGGLRLMPLPPHPKLDEFSGGLAEYQRISVACGLAQDAFSLGRIVPARDVEDDRDVAHTKSNRLDRDDLYAK